MAYVLVWAILMACIFLIPYFFFFHPRKRAGLGAEPGFEPMSEWPDEDTPLLPPPAPPPSREAKPPPGAVVVKHLRLGDTVHLMTANQHRYSFKLIDEESGCFELRGYKAERLKRPFLYAYVLKSMAPGLKEYPGCFAGDCQLFFQWCVPGGQLDIGYTTGIERILIEEALPASA